MRLNGLPLSFNQIRTFYGPNGTATNLVSYYRGSQYVPDVPENSNIPTTGTIAISNFVNAYFWPVDYTVINANIPSCPVTVGNGAQSDHAAGWYINNDPNLNPYYTTQGFHTNQNGQTDGNISDHYAPYTGVVGSSCFLGYMVQLQQFLQTYCLGGGTFPTAYAEHQTQGAGYTHISYNAPISVNNSPTVYTDIGGSLSGIQITAALIPIMLHAVVPSGKYAAAQQLIINQLLVYTWDGSIIAANFEDFATWLNTGVSNPPTVTGGGAGPSGGGGGSVSIAASMPMSAKLAGEMTAGDRLILLNADRNGIRDGEVTGNRVSIQNLLTLVSESGIRLTCSDNTPITLEDGTACNSTDVLGLRLPVLDENGFRWETIVELNDAGRGPVATISCLDQCYAAGDENGRYIITHNAPINKS